MQGDKPLYVMPAREVRVLRLLFCVDEVKYSYRGAEGTKYFLGSLAGGMNK